MNSVSSVQISSSDRHRSGSDLFETTSARRQQQSRSQIIYHFFFSPFTLEGYQWQVWQEMAEVEEEQRRKNKRTKKASGGKETIGGGRWPVIKPKKDIQLNRLKGTHLFTVCFSSIYSVKIFDFNPTWFWLWGLFLLLITQNFRWVNDAQFALQSVEN